jgi:hypothetical protein
LANISIGQPLKAPRHLSITASFGGHVMEVLNQEHVRIELIQLTEKQVSTLEKRKFVGLTEAELRQFEERQKRIRDLFIELHHLDWAA